MKRVSEALPDMEKLASIVRGRLTPKRYAHSIAVRRRAVHLAGLWGADWYKAGVAGLVHDVCKDMGHGAQLNYLRSCGIMLDDLTLENPRIWHAIAGAEYAESVMGISDRETLGAILYHTTGRRAMTPLEKVVYVADFTSDDRDYPDVAVMRSLSERSLEAAIFYSSRYIVRMLSEKGKPVTQDTWEAYNYYLPYYTELFGNDFTHSDKMKGEQVTE